MGKRSKTKGTVASVELDPEVAAKVEQKQKDGDAAAGVRKYGEALEAYSEALKLLPEKHSAIANLHGSKAAVYLMDKKYKEAIKECNLGLGVEGTNAKVLLRRSKARSELGMYKDALSDIQKVNASPEKNAESEALEAHLKNAVAGKASPQAASPVTKEQASKALQASGHQIACKVTLDGETKYIHLPYGINYHMLQKLLREKWTGLVNFKIYYQDRDNEWVNITCHRDVLKSQQEVLQHAQRIMNARQRSGMDGQMPSCRLKLEKCRRGDVPPTPKEEVPKGEEKSKVMVKSADPHAEETVVELDDWLIDFANLFRDHLGIDPDRHVDVQSEGYEKCSRALDSAVKMPEATELMDEAKDRFRDVTCIGLYNWGNVYVCQAKKLMEAAAEEGKPAKDIQAEFDKLMTEATRRYDQSLEFNANYVDGYLGIGQVRLEEAKMAAGLLIPPLEPVEQDVKELDQDEIEELNKSQTVDANAKLRAALKNVNKADVEKSAAKWKAVYDAFAKAAEVSSSEKKAKTAEREASRSDAVMSPAFPDETHQVPNQVQIMWGNALYDQSQLWAGMGLDGWKDMVLEAKKRFLDATCKEKDVIEALRNHISSEHLDLPPEPVPEPPKPAPAPAPAADKGPKGLPALNKAKKKVAKK